MSNTQLALNVGGGSPIPFGTEFVLIANDGTDAILGTFNGLPEGAYVPDFSPLATISYRGGDGNDVTITTVVPLNVTIVTGGKSATFTDTDGDLVTVKTTAGTFTPASFGGIQTGVISGGQLQKLTLDATFAGANITVTAKPSILGGNGFVNIGFIDATDVDLGAVSLPGDLGRISAGTDGGSAKVPGLKSLAVQSLGLLGTSTQGLDAALESTIKGALITLTVKDDVRASITLSGATDGILGKATIGGSIVSGDDAPSINAAAGIGSLKVGGDVRTTGSSAIFIESPLGAIGALAIGGSIAGTDNALVTIRALGQLAAPAKGIDTAIKSIAVKGSVERAFIHAGADSMSPSAKTTTRTRASAQSA